MTDILPSTGQNRVEEVEKMPKKNTPKHITEVTWSVGPDGTFGPTSTDPLGMYTGNPESPYDEPVQDADDL